MWGIFVAEKDDHKIKKMVWKTGFFKQALMWGMFVAGKITTKTEWHVKKTY